MSVLDRLQSLWRRARGEPILLAAFAVLAGGVFGFAKIADEMSEAETRPFDEAVLHFLHPYADQTRAIGPWWMDRVALDLTSLGSTAVLVTIALIVAGFLILKRKWSEVILLVAALAGGLILSETMKDLFERERPAAAYRSFDVLNSSFPSGHALLSTVTYLTLAAMLAGALNDRRTGIYVLSVGVVLALLVGVTRIYLAAHWTTDVLAGWCLGGAWATACWMGERALSGRLIPSPETPSPRG